MLVALRGLLLGGPVVAPVLKTLGGSAVSAVRCADTHSGIWSASCRQLYATGPGVRPAPKFVLTHHAPDTPVPGVTFVGDLDSGIAAAKAAAGDKYVNVLGASTAQQCLEAGVLDEILVLIAPVLLGDGVRLFDRPGGTNVELERLSLTHTPQVTNLWLRVVR